MGDILVHAVALEAESFAPYGDVIGTEGRPSRKINDGTCLRFDDLAAVDVLEAGGRPLISVFEADPRALPLKVRALERHPLSSQAFVPLQPLPFLVVVAADGVQPLAERIRVFHSSGRQGVNYRRNTWHHPLIALGQVSRFLVVDRGGPHENCEELELGVTLWVDAPRAA
jgi:ureidoglycolate lyase